jgi:hypothetical protein
MPIFRSLIETLYNQAPKKVIFFKNQYMRGWQIKGGGIERISNAAAKISRANRTY